MWGGAVSFVREFLKLIVMKTGQEILSSHLLFNKESYYSSTRQGEMYIFYSLDYQGGNNLYSQHWYFFVWVRIANVMLAYNIVIR